MRHDHPDEFSFVSTIPVNKRTIKSLLLLHPLSLCLRLSLIVVHTHTRADFFLKAGFVFGTEEEGPKALEAFTCVRVCVFVCVRAGTIVCECVGCRKQNVVLRCKR